MSLTVHKCHPPLSKGPIPLRRLMGLSVFLVLLVGHAYSATVVAEDEDLIYLSDGRVEFREGKVPSRMSRMRTGYIATSSYVPTVLNKMSEAYEIYHRMRTDYREKAECTNMAHVWASEEYKHSGLKSQKLFIFFTRKYIMRYRFHWWFHVSPMVQVKTNEKLERVVLDRRYTSLPLDTKTWSDHFVKTERPCKEAKNFSTFWNDNSGKEDCYLLTGTMYDWQPRDIRLKEKGVEKKAFRASEVKSAYHQAF